MGMFSTGVAKPDIRTDGTPMAKAPRMACCWVALIAEIIRPMPTTDRMNRMRLTSSSPNEPLNGIWNGRSEEHTSELQSLMRISYAVFCLKKKKEQQTQQPNN